MTILVFVLVIIAAGLHAGWNFAAKKVTGNLSVIWLGLCLASMLTWPGALLVYQSSPLTREALLYMVATGVLHAWYFGFLARSYELGDLSLVYPVARGTGVAGTAVVALVLLHETLSVNGSIAIIAICMGTALVGFSHLHDDQGVAAYLHALHVGAIITSYSVVDKLGVGQVHPMFYISGMVTLAALLLTPYILWRKPAEWRHAWRHLKRYSCLIGIGSIGTYLIILFTFQLGQVSYIVATREFAVVIGSGLGFLLLKERFTVPKVIGITAITMGLVLLKIA